MKSTSMVLISIVFVATFKRWYEPLQIEKRVTDKFGDQVLDLVAD